MISKKMFYLIVVVTLILLIYLIALSSGWIDEMVLRSSSICMECIGIG